MLASADSLPLALLFASAGADPPAAELLAGADGCLAGADGAESEAEAFADGLSVDELVDGEVVDGELAGGELAGGELSCLCPFAGLVVCEAELGL